MSLMPVCELWIPDDDGTFLKCAAGSYAGYEDFGRKSEGVVFAKGEGLPGRVWSSRRPEILGTLEAPSDFVRAKAAVADDLSAGLGLPIMRNGEVIAVFDFLFAQGPEPTGIMEIWSPNTDGDALCWHGGFYGQLDDIKELSMGVEFAKGQGLPGRAWESRRPELITKLWPASDDFVREEVAAVAGLTTGIAIPVIEGDQVQSVVTLLSSSDTPFGKVMEVWCPDDEGKVMKRHAGFYGRHGTFLKPEDEVTFTRGEGLPGQVWESGMPQLIAPLDEDSGFARYKRAQSAHLSVAIGLPVIDGGEVTSVILFLN